MITPEFIAKARFHVVSRGYDMAEVDAFMDKLQALAAQPAPPTPQQTHTGQSVMERAFELMSEIPGSPPLPDGAPSGSDYDWSSSSIDSALESSLFDDSCLDERR